MNQVVEANPFGNFPSKLHHLHSCCPNVDGYITRFLSAVNNVKLNAIDVMEFAVKRYFFHVKKPAQDLNSFTHCRQWFASLDSDFAG